MTQVKVALSQALEMSETDRVDRMRRNLEFSSRLTTLNWFVPSIKTVPFCPTFHLLITERALFSSFFFRIVLSR